MLGLLFNCEWYLFTSQTNLRNFYLGHYLTTIKLYELLLD